MALQSTLLSVRHRRVPRSSNNSMRQTRQGGKTTSKAGLGLLTVVLVALVLCQPSSAFSDTAGLLQASRCSHDGRILSGIHRKYGRVDTRKSDDTTRLLMNGLPNSENSRSTAPSRLLAFEGRPSSPGWKSGRLDELTDWAVADEANRDIICPYEPDGLWLWTKWRGTVLKLVIAPVLVNMCVCAGVDLVINSSPGDGPFVQNLLVELQGVNKMWEYQLTLTTFILTFFTAEAYKHWKDVYFTTRAIQGRINDICLLVTIGAARGERKEWEDASGVHCTGYTPEAEELVEVCTRLIKLSHTFFWAVTPTCSDGVGDGGIQDGDHVDELAPELRSDNAIAPVLLSRAGLQGLVNAGVLTFSEKKVLIGSGLPPSQYTYILMEWVGLNIMEGLKNGTLSGGPGFEENLLRQITSLRAEYFSIGDFAAGRMPLAYVQLVQVLVDSLVIFAAFGLYPEVGKLAIPLTGILTLFYKGLLELSKSFLDPFGVEGYPGQNIRVDVLVSELNFGAGSRWVKAGASFPSKEHK